MQWAPETGAWLVWWMRYQIFAPLFLLQLLNLFWYFLIWRIAYRYVQRVILFELSWNKPHSALQTGGPDDERSDDEDDDGGVTEKK